MTMTRKSVLVVDDDESARDFVAALMAAEGWHVIEAANGVEALDLAQSELPSLIVLDVSMPQLDGFEVYRRLRTGVFTKDLPIIMLTAINTEGNSGQHDENTMAQQSGLRPPEGFVNKPVDPVFFWNTVFGIVG